MTTKNYYNKIKISNPYKGRRFAVGDIHACYYTFKELIENQLSLKKNDQLFILGDIIDKGPHSKKTLDYILKLIKKGYLIYPLRGNHEETLIYTSENESKKILKWLVRKSPNLLNQGKLHTKYKDFIKSLPFYYELDNFFLVHANFNYNIEKPFKDKSSMLWKRKFDYNAKTLKNKTLVHGHQPTEIGDIKCMIRKKKKVICLDNGVNYIRNHKLYNYLQMGSLCALNLDTFELTIQKNIEFEKKNANTILI